MYPIPLPTLQLIHIYEITKMQLWIIQTNSNDFQLKQASYNNQMILVKDINLNQIKLTLPIFTRMNCLI